MNSSTEDLTGSLPKFDTLNRLSKISKLINVEALRLSFKKFKSATPFDHCVIDDFLSTSILESIEAEFLNYHSERWFNYKNPIEDKKALNDWNAFPRSTYDLFAILNSAPFVDLLSELMSCRLYDDPGLHGGGWHSHGTGGNLNPHLDYSIHPKLGLQRRLNLIIYVSREMNDSYGGHLGFWSHDSERQQPGQLVTEIAPKFNRAVIFDTTQDSWHGMSRPLTQPEGVYRKSLAIYYLCEPAPGADERGRALFAPRENQKGDKEIEEIIKLRSNVQTSSKVYRK